MAPQPPHSAADDFHSDIVLPTTALFIMMHLACLGMIWTGVSWTGLIVCVVLYLVRMFGVTAGYHRYFSHRSYRASRIVQFLIAALAQSSLQQGALWWAAKHREHHKHSDTPLDVHSPRHHGFWFSHFGWIFSARRSKADYGTIKDLTKYPELVWLNRNKHVPGILLSGAVVLTWGWSVYLLGFVFSTVLLYHGTFAINSLAHVVGSQRYVTGDDSRNNWWLALFTLGEGWHNNHHHYQRATRQGFLWWEIDITYYVLKLLSYTGLVYDLHSPPASIVRDEVGPTEGLLDRVARQLASSFSIDRICERLRESWEQSETLQELRVLAQVARARAEALIAEVHVPKIALLSELQARAQEMFAPSPWLEQIVQRSQEIITRAVSRHLFGEPIPADA